MVNESALEAENRDLKRRLQSCAENNVAVEAENAKLRARVRELEQRTEAARAHMAVGRFAGALYALRGPLPDSAEGTEPECRSCLDTGAFETLTRWVWCACPRGRERSRRESDPKPSKPESRST